MVVETAAGLVDCIEAEQAGTDEPVAEPEVPVGFDMVVEVEKPADIEPETAGRIEADQIVVQVVEQVVGAEFVDRCLTKR